MEKIPDIIKRILERRWVQEILIITLLLYLSILDDGYDVVYDHSIQDGFFLMFFVYLNAQIYRFYIFPKFLGSNNWKKHVFASLLLILTSSSLSFYIDLLSNQLGWYDDFTDQHLRLFVFYMLMHLICLMIVFLILIAIEFYKQKKREHAYEQQLQQMELSLLRNQLKPHFLFNTLNNLYGISLEQPERIPDMIMKLSKIMRYQLESIQQEWVTVEQTLDFFKAYVAVETERVAQRCHVSFDIQVKDATKLEKKISPMILFSFVDNAFKHGTADISQSFIHLFIQLNSDGLCLSVKNSISKNAAPIPSTGTGLENAKNLLTLLYPKQHRLQITKENETFQVVCEIYFDLPIHF